MFTMLTAAWLLHAAPDAFAGGAGGTRTRSTADTGTARGGTRGTRPTDTGRGGGTTRPTRPTGGSGTPTDTGTAPELPEPTPEVRGPSCAWAGMGASYSLLFVPLVVARRFRSPPPRR